MKIRGRPARWLIAFAYYLQQIWVRTLRYQIDDPGGFLKLPPNERVIGALWHNRLFLWPHVARHFIPHRRAVALISASRDGEMLSEFVRRYDVEVARGSSSRRGASAMLQLADVLQSGRDVAITPDGPRGPAYQLGAGIVFLAQKSGAPLLPTNFEFSSCWRLGSWDRFIIPKPFSKVRVIFGPLLPVRPTATDEEFEAERLRLQNAIMQIVEML